ncbi:hypothetical protein [Paraburkholderia sp. 22B1P]|uniref:hypothetical protein n=1 Tax=Paraburkholderia sp. 22B1P TaxID=3080498 RepID=UPI0030D55D18
MTTRERDDEWFRKALSPELDPQDAHQDLVRFRRFDARSLELVERCAACQKAIHDLTRSGKLEARRPAGRARRPAGCVG